MSNDKSSKASESKAASAAAAKPEPKRRKRRIGGDDAGTFEWKGAPNHEGDPMRQVVIGKVVKADPAETTYGERCRLVLEGTAATAKHHGGLADGELAGFWLARRWATSLAEAVRNGTVIELVRVLEESASGLVSVKTYEVYEA